MRTPFEPNPHGDRWFDEFDKPENVAKIDRIESVLIVTFPDIPRRFTRHWASSIFGRQQAAFTMFHNGQEDVDKLDQFSARIDEANKLLSEMSPWASQMLSVMFSGIDPRRDLSGGIRDFGLFYRDLPDAIELTKNMIRDTRPEGNTNWKAVAVADGVLECWTDLTQKKTPASELNEEGPVADLMRDVFEALSIDANPRAAFRAWKNTKVQR